MTNPRVMAWARSRGVNHTRLVREDPDKDQFLVDGLPWTILYSEWIMRKWREWWTLCPLSSPAGLEHYFDAEGFDAWLQRGSKEDSG